MLDWYITLAEKDTLASCEMTHVATEDQENTTVVETFIPLHRSLSISPLSSNTSYLVNVVCGDKQGGRHASQSLHFTTGRCVIMEIVISY